MSMDEYGHYITSTTFTTTVRGLQTPEASSHCPLGREETRLRCTRGAYVMVWRIYKLVDGDSDDHMSRDLGDGKLSSPLQLSIVTVAPNLLLSLSCLDLFSMPVLVEGLPVTAVTLTSSRHSVLPSLFRTQLRPGSSDFLVTTVSGHHRISFPIAFTISTSSSSHVELGLDWAALLRDSLIGLGHRVDSSFDAARFLSDPIYSNSHFPLTPRYIDVPCVGPILSPGEITTSVMASASTSTLAANATVASVANLTPSLEDLLISPNTLSNIFLADAPTLLKLMKAHHIVRPSKLTIRGARHALISHLVVGSCAGKCDAIMSAIVEHECHCRDICHEFVSQQAMAFTALSTLLSASPDHFPDSHVVLVGGGGLISQANFMRQRNAVLDTICLQYTLK
ncbi:hypothetical protein B0H13DRAFT_2289997 [Mycena leptocephala]|nr:hypothetical protein B0H13DRAFT_2289997 [Mycena leptocephala]